MRDKNRIIYKRIPVYDAATSDLLSYADSIVSFISSGLHHGSVLVHCQRGVSRSATSVVFFLMSIQWRMRDATKLNIFCDKMILIHSGICLHRKAGMTMDESLDLCRSRRPVVDPIPAFLEQLRQYEEKCKGVIGKRKALASSKQKKRKRVIGPVMGPQPQTIKPDAENESKRRAAIGPQLPSHLTSQDTINKVTIIESAIGPQLPVSRTQDDDNQKSCSSAAPIGPMMPPPSDI
eukprot:scaffold202677_cov51-Attheya_sp.AAC.2